MFASKAIGLSRRLERIPYPRIPYQGGSVFLPRNILDFLGITTSLLTNFKDNNLFWEKLAAENSTQTGYR
jgi:hypothetical protein